MNGEVFIRDRIVYFKGEDFESQVVAAEYLYKIQARMDDHHEWRLLLKDGSEVQWTMELRKHGMQRLADTLQNMPSTRPKVENQFHFGLKSLDVREKLQALEQGIGCGDIIPQEMIATVSHVQNYFELKQLTIVYAEKKVP